MLSQRPNRTLIRAARAQIDGGGISNAVRQVWAFCEPVIPVRAFFPFLRGRRFRFFDDVPSLTLSRCTPRQS